MSKMKKETKTKLIKLLIIIIALVVLVLAIYLPLKLTGAIDKIDSAEELGEFIRKGGVYSYIIFFLLQFLQVTFLPLPAAVTTIAGTLVFKNVWVTFALSLSAVLCGSAFAFFLGRKVGRKLVVWVAGEKDAAKWEEKLKRGKFVFFLMMLFPIFPDDILCIVAGCIGMDWKFFIIANLISRPISIGCLCFFGSGSIIPFSGWGIPVWIVLIIAGIILFYLSVKFQPQIEDFIVKIANKITGKTTINKIPHVLYSQNHKVIAMENHENLQIPSIENISAALKTDKKYIRYILKNKKIKKDKENHSHNIKK